MSDALTWKYLTRSMYEGPYQNLQNKDLQDISRKCSVWNGFIPLLLSKYLYLGSGKNLGLKERKKF